MKNIITFPTLLILGLLAFAACSDTREQGDGETILFKNVNLIDGNGGAPVVGTSVLVRGDKIAAIGTVLDEDGARVVDLSGKTMMPALICAHAHVGMLKGTGTDAGNYTRENLLSQLKKYADYGVLQVQAMGTDRPVLFENGLYDSIRKGLLPGARMLSAAYGFNVPDGGQSPNSPMNLLYRPVTAQQVPVQMDSLAALGVKMVKIWVDDFGGSTQKMDTSIYRAVIREAHAHGLQVAAHLYYLSDARMLVQDGVDIIAHSIRDSVIDDHLVAEMKRKGVGYIPTLSLDEFSFVYSRSPEWVDDPFFKASLEPGVYEMITSEQFRENVRNSPGYARNIAGFETALANLKKIAAGGVLVAMGTDSGALPVRAQGFSEHLELELMVQAGLTPLEAITAATHNAAVMLKIGDRFGTIETGKMADLLILDADPSTDIKNSRRIASVYKAGTEL